MIFHLRAPFAVTQPSLRRTARVSVGKLYSVNEQVQGSLIWLGYDLGPTGADGKIGPKTESAIIAFKKAHGESPADATITEELMKNLVAAVAAKSAPATESTPAPAPAPPSGMTATPANGVSTGGIVIALVALLVVGTGIFFFST